MTSAQSHGGWSSQDMQRANKHMDQKSAQSKTINVAETSVIINQAFPGNENQAHNNEEQ